MPRAAIEALRAGTSVLHFDAPLRKIFHAQRISERLRQRLEFQNFLGVGFFVDAMQRSDAARFEIARHGLIRGQHEFLDQAVRDVALAADDAGHLPGIVKFKHLLGQIEIDGAEPRAPRVENQGQVAHGAEIFGEVRVLGGGGRIVLKHGVHRGVRHALGRANHAAREFRRDNFAVRVEFHDRAHHQAVFPRIERADAVREFFRQHGHGAIRKINGSAAQPRLAVQGRSAPHVMRNVGDVHLQLPVAVFEALHVHRVVKIARRFAVNRDDRQIAEVAPPGALDIAHGMRRRGGFRQHVRGKFVRQMMLADQDLHVHAEIAGAPENLDHASRRGHAAARKARHLHVDDGAIEFRQTHASFWLMQA